jgi:cell wall assembly regulator SMI1
MKELWLKMERWLSIHAPHLLDGLQKGASRGQIAFAEDALEILLPKDVVDFYTVHNGQAHPECFALYQGALINGCLLLPLETVVKHWRDLKSVYDGGDFAGITSGPDGPIKDDWWNPRWVPMTSNSSGDHPVCLDFDPAEGGERGQIISWWHDDPNRRLVAASLRSWLAGYLEDIENGLYVYSDDYDAILDRRYA